MAAKFPNKNTNASVFLNTSGQGVEQILDSRIRSGNWEYKVKWNDCLGKENTWELLEDLSCFYLLVDFEQMVDKLNHVDLESLCAMEIDETAENSNTTTPTPAESEDNDNNEINSQSDNFIDENNNDATTHITGKTADCNDTIIDKKSDDVIVKNSSNISTDIPGKSEYCSQEKIKNQAEDDFDEKHSRAGSSKDCNIEEIHSQSDVNTDKKSSNTIIDLTVSSEDSDAEEIDKKCSRNTIIDLTISSAESDAEMINSQLDNDTDRKSSNDTTSITGNSGDCGDKKIINKSDGVINEESSNASTDNITNKNEHHNAEEVDNQFKGKIYEVYVRAFTKSPFARGLRPQKIVAAEHINGEMRFVIKFGGNPGHYDFIPAKVANVKWPQTVAKFFDEKISSIKTNARYL